MDRPPWLDYNVPEGQQIVRFGSSGPQLSDNNTRPFAVSNAMGKDGGESRNALMPQ